MELFADIMGESPGVFFGLTVILFGGCAWMTGQALARTWRPAWQMLPAGIGLTMGERFLDYALFSGELLSGVAILSHYVFLVAVGLVAFRLAMAHQMVRQYPWLYDRAGIFSWRDKG
jgi:branched-chain amino acid transport system ATP-binding protein